jgi:hypothetical protein
MEVVGAIVVFGGLAVMLAALLVTAWQAIKAVDEIDREEKEG